MTNQEIGRSLASSFVEMAQALDLLPKVEADLNDTKAALDKANSEIAFLRSHNVELGDRVVALEADLAQATKSATGHKTNVDLLLDEARRVMGNLATAVELVDPKPVPVQPEVALPNPLHVGDSIYSQSAPMTGEDTSHPIASRVYEGFRHEDQPNQTIGEALEIAHNRGIEQPPFDNPTSPSGNEPTSSAQSGGQSEAPPQDVGSSGDGSERNTGNPSSSTTTDDTPATSNEPQAQPMSRPYWLKPSNTTWRTWQSLNGDIPHWISAEMMDLV